MTTYKRDLRGRFATANSSSGARAAVRRAMKNRLSGKTIGKGKKHNPPSTGKGKVVVTNVARRYRAKLRRKKIR